MLSSAASPHARVAAAPQCRSHIVRVAATASSGAQRSAEAAAPSKEQAPGSSRRALLACGLVLPALAALPPSSSAAEPFMTVRDETLAYQFDYPVATASGRALPMVMSRRPEKYSSAAPLTADARQRIVCELADLIDTVTVSVTVGPPGGILKGIDPSQWTPKAVAEQVLIDRSTGRITSGQRISLNSVESVAAEERDGVTYYIYEHTSQGSPTLRNPSRETYRRALAASAVRPGKDGTPFVYTLNLACPNELWEGLEGPFRHCVESFTLLPPGSKYVAPDENPFLFF